MLTMGTAQAQGKISGVVQDSATHEPLAFASVFLANTTLGVTTTEQGRFEFAKVPAGTYDVVGSYVGYSLSKKSVTMTAAPQQVTLELASTGNQLGEVVVKPEPNKPDELRQFTTLFLGGTSFSEQCYISNPDQVRIFLDEETGELTARAKEFLQIDNEALGYRLKYYGLEFGYDKADGTMSYYGEPVFEEMTPRDERQQQQWAANRATAYRGSFMHFLRSVYNDRLEAEGFLAQQIRMAPNPHFRRIENKRRALQRRPAGNLTRAEKDSLARWQSVTPTLATLYPAPRPIDSLRRVSLNGEHTFLRFTGELQVAYFGEAPDARYTRRMLPLGATRKPYPAKRQVSRLRLEDGEAEIQANGSLMNPLEVVNGEYWGFERIGEFLPVDYVLPAASAKP
ncbi:hypothetical protein BEN48_04995 [Hymenobacter glacialis]|uniref:Carboxypeptidase-like regulatory domain-containing protein n=2 Tax=Hymenobacter glacialis TaxID=1908236 RepID=A0A1G1SUM1_9BACT|nr:hypothetical protein BEN48_04995 [Hymenobacter glacialis]